MASIMFVRHGQASFGSDNYDKLSPLGTQQAELLGAYLKATQRSFDYVVGGTMQRHYETFLGVDKSLASTNNYLRHDGWNEYDHEALFNAYLVQFSDDCEVTSQRISDFYGDRRLYHRILQRALHAWSTGKLVDLTESWCEFNQRVNDALNDVANNVSHSALVSASGGSLSLAMMLALKMPVEHAIDFSFQMKNTAINQLFLSAGKWHLHSFNSMAHLENDKYRALMSYG